MVTTSAPPWRPRPGYSNEEFLTHTNHRKNLQNWASNYIKLIKHLPDFLKSSNRPAVTIKVMMRVWLPHRQPQWQSTSSQHVPASQVDPRAWWSRVGPAVDVLRVLHEDEGKGRHIATFRNHGEIWETTQISTREVPIPKGTWALDWHLSTWLAPNGFSKLKTCCHGCHGVLPQIQQAIRSLAKVYSLLLPASENLKRFPMISPATISRSLAKQHSELGWENEDAAYLTWFAALAACIRDLRSHQPRHIWNIRIWNIWSEYDEYVRNGRMCVVRSRQICFPFFLYKLERAFQLIPAWLMFRVRPM